MMKDTHLILYRNMSIFGMNAKDWPLVCSANKGIDAALATIKARRCRSNSDTNTEGDTASPLDAQDWISNGPNIVINDLERRMDYKSFIRYFNEETVRKHLTSRGQLVEQDGFLNLEADYQLRQSVDLLCHILSRSTVALDDSTSEPPTPNLRRTAYGHDVVDYHVSEYASYKSLFSIKFLPPDLRTKYESTNGPSYSELFLSLFDSVITILRCIAFDDKYNISELEKRCQHIDLFLGRKGTGHQYVRDVLQDYCDFGFLKLLDEFPDGASLSDMFVRVGEIDVSRLKPVGRTKADIGFSFAPCGFLIPYYLGVMSFMSELKLINVTTPLAGGSAGTLAIVCATSIKPDFVGSLSLVEEISDLARREGVRYRLDDYLKSVLDSEMKPGAYLGVNDRLGPLSIAITSRGIMAYKRSLVSHFTDDHDLKDGVRASCNIPFFSTRSTIIFRGARSYDGYFANMVKNMFCHDTDALRTVRVNPFITGNIKFRSQRLKNDYIVPMLMNNDRYTLHYLRLKGFIRELWKRKFYYEGSGDKDGWRVELSLIIDNYEMLSGGQKVYRQGIWSDLMKLWSVGGYKEGAQEEDARHGEEPAIARLFMLVIASEVAHKVGPGLKYCARNYKGDLKDVNLLSKFVSTGLNPLVGIMNFRATPYCLIDWLQHEYELTSATKHRYMSNSAVQDAQISTLKELLHSIAPPQSLSYHYTEFPYLLPNSTGNLSRSEKALLSCSRSDIRLLYDVGRCDAFRWMVAEFITLENWLYLRIRQLEERTSPLSGGGPSKKSTSGSKSANEAQKGPLHARQHEYLSEFMDFMDKDKLEKLVTPGEEATPKNRPMRLEDVQNRVARRALMLDIIDPHFSHILCHSGLWEG